MRLVLEHKDHTIWAEETDCLCLFTAAAAKAARLSAGSEVKEGDGCVPDSRPARLLSSFHTSAEVV